MKTNSKCYLCGCKDLKRREGRVRDSDSLEVCECTSCGLVFLSSFDHIADGFYEQSGMHDTEKMPEIEAWLRDTAWDDERRFQYLKSALPNRRLLDFGCGTGGFILRARELAAAAQGVEPEVRLRDHYDSHGLSVFSSLSEIPQDLRGQGYDLITMFHVLEHIPDPRTILLKLSEFLTQDGQIVVEVPNADDALLALYRSEAFSHFTYWSCHLFLFTTKTLGMLVSQAGLKINYVQQIQRYPLSNHLHWLATGKPGGHQKWHFLDSPDLHAAYEKQLAALGKCDTIIASVSKS
jgi:2-polyprenyl-3-methyl-5-hydroxy-6-metoxy-1,4-benzoquinol methylase